MTFASVLLDRGNEWIELIPDKTEYNRNGTPVHMPDFEAEPIKVRCSTSLDRGQIPELTGQVTAPAIRVVTRYLPVGHFSVCRYAGELWDMSIPPRQTPGLKNGFSSGARHTQFTMKGRNQGGVNVKNGAQMGVAPQR